MQLTFTKDELQLLLDLLLEHERQAQLAHRTSDDIVPLLPKFLSHDFALGVDEMEDLEEFLKDVRYRIERERAKCKVPAAIQEFERRHKLIQQMEDRVTEACSMA